MARYYTSKVRIHERVSCWIAGELMMNWGISLVLSLSKIPNLCSMGQNLYLFIGNFWTKALRLCLRRVKHVTKKLVEIKKQRKTSTLITKMFKTHLSYNMILSTQHNRSIRNFWQRKYQVFIFKKKKKQEFFFVILDTKPYKTKKHKMFDYSYHGPGGSASKQEDMLLNLTQWHMLGTFNNKSTRCGVLKR
jgi:hypothetical protein